MAPLCAHVGGRVGAHGDPREVGVEGVPSTLATAIRTVVVLVVVWLATVWLGEPLSWRLGAGVFLMTMGALLTLS